jgi:hypothetical protein
MLEEIQRIKDANDASVQPDSTIRKLTDEIERLPSPRCLLKAGRSLSGPGAAASNRRAARGHSCL